MRNVSEASDEGFYPNFRAWLTDLIAGTHDVIENADRMGLKDWQREELEAEAGLYANLAELLDTGKPTTGSPAPVDREIIGQVQATLDRWAARFPEAEQMDLSPSQTADLERTKKAVSMLQPYVGSYPVANQ